MTNTEQTKDVNLFEQVLNDESTTKSHKIRTLHSMGLKTSEITKLMKTKYPNFIYQHARNILNQPLKKQS